MGWGGVSGRLQVGLSFTTDAYDTNTPHIDVYVRAHIRVVNYRYDDNQTLNVWGSVSATVPFRNYQPSYGTYEWVAWTGVMPDQGQSYGGGPTYSVGVSITGAFDGSSPSYVENFTLPARPANVPTQPGVSIGQVTANAANVWVSAADGRGSGVQEYAVELWQQPNILLQSWGGGSSYRTGLVRDTGYTARARARNGVGWGAWSGWADFRTPPTAPSAPRNLTAGNAGPSSVELTWQAAADTGGSPAQTGFDVEAATDAGFTQRAAFVTVPAGTLAHDLQGLSPGGHYWVRVRQGNTVGVGAWSNVVEVDTLSKNRVKLPEPVGWTPVRVWVKVPGRGWVTARVWKKAPGVGWVQ